MAVNWYDGSLNTDDSAWIYAQVALPWQNCCTWRTADFAIPENSDEGPLALRNITPQTVSPEEFLQRRHEFAHGNSGLPIIGDPDRVAGTLIELSRAGLTGIAVSLVNFAGELPYLAAEVLPRLERAGLRLPA